MAKDTILIPEERIERSILLIRGNKVMLDSDLAALYGVETKSLNKAVKRNLSRFPVDFMFQLTHEEADALRSQFATSKPRRGGRRYRPYAFTEQGVAMLSSVLPRNPKGCQKLAGGRSQRRPPDRRPESRHHPGGVAEA